MEEDTVQRWKENDESLSSIKLELLVLQNSIEPVVDAVEAMRAWIRIAARIGRGLAWLAEKFHYWVPTAAVLIGLWVTSRDQIASVLTWLAWWKH